MLLTGASGFVGRRLAPVLEAVGWHVRCVSRNAADMQRQWPERTWLQADLSQTDDVERALTGCQVAYYLVHSLGQSSHGLFVREQATAEMFAVAAERAGVERIVYLGAIAPQGSPSEHLRSRLEVGRVLRAGRVSSSSAARPATARSRRCCSAGSSNITRTTCSSRRGHFWSPRGLRDLADLPDLDGSVVVTRQSAVTMKRPPVTRVPQ